MELRFGLVLGRLAVHTKNNWTNYEQLYRGVFVMLPWAKLKEMKIHCIQCNAQRLRRVKLIIRRYCFSKLPWVISECPAPFVDANIAQGWL